MLKLLTGIFLSAAVLAATSFGTEASAAECKMLGGTGMANAIDDSNLVASLTGGLAGGARARITAQQQTDSGLSLDMEHHFFTDEGGLLQTSDKATLTAVPGKTDIYMLEISYEVVDASGAFLGYRGGFRSFGLIDLGVGEVVLRYSGDICK